MKKATTKRERKYGKKETDVVTEPIAKTKIRKKVAVMVDYAMIIDFPNKKAADDYINKQHKEADEALRPRSSFTYV